MNSKEIDRVLTIIANEYGLSKKTVKKICEFQFKLSRDIMGVGTAGKEWTFLRVDLPRLGKFYVKRGRTYAIEAGKASKERYLRIKRGKRLEKISKENKCEK